MDRIATFNGTSDGVIYDSVNVPGSQITIAVWVYLRSSTAWGTLIKNWGDSSSLGAFHFGLDNASGQVSAYVQQTDQTVAGVVDPNPAPLNTWTLYTFTEDGTNLNLYRDSLPVGSSPYDGTIETGNHCIGIGVKPNDACNDHASSNEGYLDGYINQIMVWDTAISPSEVQAVSTCQ